MKHVVRIFCEKINTEFVLNEVNRIQNVMRLKIGNEFLAFNEVDGEWVCEITRIDKNFVYCKRKTLNRQVQNTEPHALAFCLIKIDAMKLIIEKCTELSITDFYPIVSKYTQISNINIGKLKSIALHAVEQSEQFCIPKIHQIMYFNDFIRNLPAEFTCATAMERFDQNILLEDNITGFIIGPEGGFAPDERTLLLEKTHSVSFSNYILRSETACIVAAVKLTNPFH